MEPVITVASQPQNSDPYESLTLDQARERIRMLLSNEESNAWDIGDLLNAIERRGLARTAGFGKTKAWLDAEIPEAQGRTSSLYRYADVAGQYSKKQVEAWGVTRLACLNVYDREVLGKPASEDPGERELQIVQEDGSTLAKKFRDCTVEELRLSNQRRKKTANGKGRTAKTRPKNEAPSIRIALALLALGILITATIGLLPDSFPTTLVLVFGTGLFFSGVGMLARRWHVAQERLLSSFKEGKAIDLLKGQVAKARGGARKLAAIVRNRGKAKGLAPAPKEETPPNEKKAA
jgi:hypothetical protein